MTGSTELVEAPGPIRWFARNRIAANLLMGLILISGLIAIPGLKVEVFPEFSADIVTVGVPYPGAAPEEVERGILLPIEEELAGLTGVKRITSTASEGAAAVTVEVRPDADVREVLDDVKGRIDAIDTFPLDAEEPIVQEVVRRNQVINIALSGATGERTLKRLGERVRDDLLLLPSISQVAMTSTRPYEISIEVAEQTLRRYGLTFSQVADAVRRSSLDVASGSVRARGGEILLRTQGQAYRGDEFQRLVLLTRQDGTRLVLGDVARVSDGFAETDQTARFDDEPVVVLQVFRVGDESALEVAAAVKSYVGQARPRLPEGISITTWRDDSKYLRGRMETLLRNAWQGLVLVFLVLTLFLRLRLSFWVSIGIPVAFLGTLALLPVLGASINILSLFAFILVLGIVVDDAIVVGENVFKRLERGDPPEIAAVSGTREVAVPVIFAVLTSITAFLPMAALPGFTGKIWRVIPAVVVPVLLFSLVESQWILPAHLVHARHRAAGERAGLLTRVASFVPDLFASGLRRFIDGVYAPSLRTALRWRYATVSAAVAVFVLAVAYAASGRLPFAFFPKLDGDDVAAEVTMALGTPAEDTAVAVAQLERALYEVAAELDDEGALVEHVLASVGEQPWRTARQRNRGLVGAAFTATHLGEVHVGLVAAEERVSDVTASELVRRWRERAGELPGAVEVEYTSELMSAGKAVDLRLASDDYADLRRAAEELRSTLATYPGVIDVSDSFRAGKREIRLAIRPEAEAQGLSLADLGRQVRQAFYGEEAQRIQRDREEVKVMVRYPEEERRSLANLERMRLRLPDGRAVPFSTVADVTFGEGVASIQRTDRRRTLSVAAEIDPTRTSSGEVIAWLEEAELPALRDRHPGLTAWFEGEQREQRETLAGLARGMAVALFAIYALMAIPFRSYLQPAIVMTAIPFGLVGAVLGHVLVGVTLSMLSVLGMVALAGIVVNDNLVLVDFINRRRRAGEGLVEAVRHAGRARFRPILLTSLTTFAGLTPLMLETSVQAQFLIPMAVALAFGVVFSTAVSLMLVPSLYLILDDLSGVVRRLWRALVGPARDSRSATDPR